MADQNHVDDEFVQYLCDKWRNVLPVHIVAQMLNMVLDGKTEGQAFTWGFQKFKAGERPSERLAERLNQIKSGKLKLVPWPWPDLTKLAPTLTPGSVTVVAGAPGAGKSFFVLECLSFWLKEGIICAMMSLESTREEHLQRLLAQLQQDANLTDMTWVRENPMLVDLAIADHAEWIDEVGRRIHSVNVEEVQYIDVIDFIRTHGAAGDKVVVIDPITAAEGKGMPWVVDKQLVWQAYQLGNRYRMAIILVSHPTKNFLEPSLAHIAGGAAYSRHGEGAIWIEKTLGKKQFCRGTCGRSEQWIDRVVHLLKVKHGRGQGLRIGFNFSTKSLLFNEHGVIVKKDECDGEAD